MFPLIFVSTERVIFSQTGLNNLTENRHQMLRWNTQLKLFKPFSRNTPKANTNTQQETFSGAGTDSGEASCKWVMTTTESEPISATEGSAQWGIQGKRFVVGV